MSGSVSASFCSVRLSRRPPDTPRNFMHENRETSETPAAQPGRRSAGEGQSHQARAYVYEESHSGVVPMNHGVADRVCTPARTGGVRLHTCLQSVREAWLRSCEGRLSIPKRRALTPL